MSFVLDNSVTMRWLFADGSPSDLAYADKVLASMKKLTAIVPVTWALEVANVLARGEAKGLVTKARSGEFVDILAGLGIAADDATFDQALSDTLKLARAYKLSAYDASYLELAVRLAVPLATLDESLRKAAKKAGVKRLAL